MTADLLDWTPQGDPRSKLYGDVYFSAEDGLAESRAVFMQGCDLPGAWAGRSRFVVGELGFGTGLNIAALITLWHDTAAPDAHLHIFSIEGHPLTAADARRALGRWPELAAVSDALIAGWPGQTEGFHRLSFPQWRVTLDLAVMEVGEALSSWRGQADAWFLDGFSPALNPAMWSPEVLRLVAQRSAPNARLATFTVAGDVRRGLQAAGFEVTKQPGFGRKRERLEAKLPGPAPQGAPLPRIAIIGAGIAGASLVRAFHALGVELLVFEADGIGSGASGNPAALVMPRLDAGLAEPAKLAAQAFARATALYELNPQAVIARGVLQVATDPDDPRRHAKIAGSGLFEPGSVIHDDRGLTLSTALVIEPHWILQAWLGPICAARIEALRQTAEGWSLIGANGETLACVDQVILANGVDATQLAPDAVLSPVRGQASWTELAEPHAPTSGGGYLIPTRNGILFGATHDRGELATDLRSADHQRNLQSLAELKPDLAASLTPESLSGRASIRATTTDYFPLAGATAQSGIFVLSGLGSRGFCWAPLLAEHVAALALGVPSPLPAPLADLIDPARFARRAARRGRNLVADQG